MTMIQLNKKNVFELLPITFLVDMFANDANAQVERFALYFNTIEKTAAKRRALEAEKGVPQAPERTLAAINARLQGFKFSSEKRGNAH